ncbi:hypothetical protein ACS0ZG_32705 [Burkholderia gladioli]
MATAFAVPVFRRGGERRFVFVPVARRSRPVRIRGLRHKFDEMAGG